MKSKFKRLMGLLLAVVMTVVMFPVTAFADAGSTFVVGNNTYYLLPDSTVEYKGETYVGVYYDLRALPGWSSGSSAGTIILGDARPDGGRYATSLLQGITARKDVQDYISYFSPFDGYMVDSDFEWSMGSVKVNETDTANTAIYFKGSVCVPSLAEYTKLNTSNGGFSDGLGFVTRNLSGTTWMLYKNATADNYGGNGRVIDENGAVTELRMSSNGYGRWSPITYVSVDFFKENKIGVGDSLGNIVKTFLTTNYTKEVMLEANIYTVDELEKIGYSISAADLTVTGVELNKTTEEVAINNTVTLTASVLPSYATNKDVVWSSADETIATVDQNGVVTGIKEGTVKIKVASTENEEKFAECEVSVVVVHPDKVELNKDKDEVYTGMETTLTAVVSPDLAYNKAVTWKSSDETIATVDQNGVVKGIKPGVATITVTTVDGSKTDTCEVTVKSRAVTGVELDKDTVTVYVGDKEEIKAIVSPDIADDKTVRWSSSNDEVATVIGGVIEGINAGTADITVTTIDGEFTATCAVTVKTKAVTGVILDENYIEINAKETKTLTATVEPSVALNKNILWKSFDETVATVVDGVITGIKPGVVDVTAISEEDETIFAECKVVVKKVAVTGITLNKTSTTSLVGKQLKLTAAVAPDNATVTDIIWTSSDESVATVENGLVSILKSGVATIKATSADDSTVFEECDITVIRGTVDSPNYLKLDGGLELLFNDVKKVGDETYLGFMIAKDYAGSSNTAGVIYKSDSLDPLGNALDGKMYGEYFFTTSSNTTNSGTSLDSVMKDIPEDMQDDILLNQWDAGLQYNLNGSPSGTAKSKMYFSLPHTSEIEKHASYIADQIEDNDCSVPSSNYTGGKAVAVVRDATAWAHMVYQLSSGTTVSASAGISSPAGSVFPTFYVNTDAFCEVKFDVDSLGADIKAAILANISRAEIKKAGYSAEELTSLGYIEDEFSLIKPISLDMGEQEIEFKFKNNDTVKIKYPLILVVAYNNKNKVIAIEKYVSNVEIPANGGIASGKLTIDIPQGAQNMGIYALKSAEEPILMGKAIVTEELYFNNSETSNEIDITITPDEAADTAVISTQGTITANTDAVVIVTKPGKTVADLATGVATDVILNIVQITSNANGKYSYRFTESTNNLEYDKYTAYIYHDTGSANDIVMYTDSGFVTVVAADYKTMSFDEFVGKYGDLLLIDKETFVLLSSEQKSAVKAAVSVDGKSVEIIVSELNNKMKTVFIDGVKTDISTMPLASFANKYKDAIIGIDAALASSMESTQEANVKAAVIIDYDSTVASIASDVNKEMAAQVVSKATTGVAVEKAIKDWNKYLGLDLVNWIEKAPNKTEVYTVIASGTYDDFEDVKETYEKAVMVNRINYISVFTEIYDIIAGYAKVDGEIYGVDADVFVELSGTDFALSLFKDYVDWADFEKSFKDNAIYYRNLGGSGGGGGGKAPSTLVQFTPEVEETVIPNQPKYMFADLKDAEWAVTYVEALAKLGHINGKGNNTFCPNDSIKREEVVKILVSALGLDVSATEASFTDVDAGAWYAPYLAAAKASGIVNGKPDGSFGIGAEITREELATMIYRAAGLLASETDVEFADEAEIADYAKEAVSTLVATGVLNGKGNNLFAPKANATRAETSKIIYLAVIGK